MLRYKYDKDVDALYIYLSNEHYSYGIDIDNQRRVDYSITNKPIGIELLYVSDGINVQGLPEQDKITEILNKEHIRIIFSSLNIHVVGPYSKV